MHQLLPQQPPETSVYRSFIERQTTEVNLTYLFLIIFFFIIFLLLLQSIKAILSALVITMHSYNQTGAFPNSGKNEVAKHLIKCLLQNNPNYCITKTDFQHLSDLLVKIFHKSGELSSTFYIPAQCGNSAKGKLFNAYCNYKCTLGKTGVILRKTKTKSKNQEANKITPLPSATSLEKNIKILNKLKKKIAPWEEVKKEWAKTLITRQNTLNNLNITKTEFYNQFWCLSQPKGYELVSLFGIILILRTETG